MADAIWLLLKSWHRRFYQFGRIDLGTLAACIGDSMNDVNHLRSRKLQDFCEADETTIKSLFRGFTIATRRKNKTGAQDSPVAAAKTLHLLCPDFFPLWDDWIAWNYGYALMWSEDYVSFCWRMKDFAAAIKPFLPPEDDRSLLKRIDEFNYAAYTKRWVPLGSSAAAP